LCLSTKSEFPVITKSWSAPMNDRFAEQRKYIVGWISLLPGRRDDFMRIARPYVETCRAEDGCLFFDMNPSSDGPDEIVIMECFRDAEAHAIHLRTPQFVDFWLKLNELGASARFENVIAREVTPDRAEFGGVAPMDQVHTHG
jgi:quinol monooxygenase YgiN